MPTYEYSCTACGRRLEAVQSFSDAPLQVCPTCGGTLRKVFGSVGIVLKGSGFYRTDNRSTSRANGDARARDGAKDGSTDHGAGSNGASGGSSAGSASSGSGNTSTAATAP